MPCSVSSSISRTLRPALLKTPLIDPTEGMTPEQRLHWRIVHRHKEGVEADIDEIINRGGFP